MTEATLTGPSELDTVPGRSDAWRQRAARGAIWGVLLGLTIMSSIVSPVFLTQRFIATLLKQVAPLGMVLMVQGARFVYTGGTPKGSIPEVLEFIGGGMVGPVPAAVIVWVAMVAVFVVLTRWTTFGRRLYAVGGNRRTAHLSGV